MRDYNRQFRPGTGDRPPEQLPHVVKSFKVDAGDDLRERSQVDDDGWVNIPVPTRADPEPGRLILVRVKGTDGFGYRLLDMEKYNRLVDLLESPEVLEEVTGTRDKSEFFCSVDAVEYHPEGKVKLSHTHLYELRTETEIEFRAVSGQLEIHRPS